MERGVRIRAMRIWLVWIAFAALATVAIVARSQGREAGSPHDLGEIQLLQASTVSLLVEDNFPNVNLRAIVGPDGCRTGRVVNLEQLVAGSTATIPMGQETTGSSGHALFTEIPNVEGTQYWVVVEGSPGCDPVTSNIVTLEGPL